MKRIGIITINDYLNFGNRLQNYAVQTIANRYGIAYTIRYFNGKSSKNIIFYMLKFICKKIKRCFCLLFKRKDVNTIKETNFNNFNKRINFKFFYCGNSSTTIIDKYFDYFFIGSDQIWNPNLFYKMNFNFAYFTRNEKKIALSPSISCDLLSKEQIEEFDFYLKNFDNLSCREKQGSKIVEKITGKNCQTLIDPTLLLSINEWNMVAKKPKYHDEKEEYILLYFLGGITHEFEKYILLLSKKKNLKIINLLDKNSIYFSCGPSEFIYLIAHCKILLTDSFHGSVFSYIYDKPFKIFDRKDGTRMNSRLSNLIETLHINKNVFFNNEIDCDELFATTYDKSYLKKEQDKFYLYLSEKIK